MKSEALSDAVRRKKLLPYAGISRQVKRSGLTFFNLFSSLANTDHALFNVIDSIGRMEKEVNSFFEHSA